MKIIAIGDIHGNNKWKSIVSNSEYDIAVFMGDYFDTHEKISSQRQKENFMELVEFKKADKDKTILLVGNHDFHYMKGIKESYSGYQELQRFDFQEMLQSALDEDLLQLCFISDKFLFSHAGVTKTWCKNALRKVKFKSGELETLINETFKYKPLEFRFLMGRNFSVYGDDVCQSPLWVRPRSLFADSVEGFTQIVGHTIQSELEISSEFVFIDTLNSSGEYLIIEDGKMRIGNVSDF